MKGAISNDVSPDIKANKGLCIIPSFNLFVEKGLAIYQSMDHLRGIGGRSGDISTISGNNNSKSRHEKLINILEEKADYLVISPPKFNRLAANH